MQVLSLRLVDFRSYVQAEVAFSPGLTAVVGANGEGKTNLLEAIGFAAGLGSLRGAADSALVRRGCVTAMIHCETRLGNAREVAVDAEIHAGRPNRLFVNRQRASRRDLLDVLMVTVFSPDDLELVKGEPAGRRRWLDEALTAVRPSCAALRSDLERILRQRNALLRQAGGRIDDAVGTTLEVWDAKLATAGDDLRARRRRLLDEMRVPLAACYGRVAGSAATVEASYVSSWGEEPLAEALAAARDDDLRRAVSTVGPHRDDLLLSVDGLPARSHASQGEQRSLALAMRLAADSVVRRHRDVEPVLLLDDVFSELDDRRAAALLEALPPGQRILTTAGSLPAGVGPDRIIRIVDGAPGVVSL